MRNSRFLTALACAVLAMVACERREESLPPPRVTTIKIAHPTDIQDFMLIMRDHFSRSDRVLPDGSTIRIELIPQRGLDDTSKLATGEEKADAWLASSTVLVDLVNATRKHLGAKQTSCTELFRTPLVLAVHEQDLDYFKNALDPLALQEILAMQFSGRVSKPVVKRMAGLLLPSLNGAEAGLVSLAQLLTFARAQSGLIGQQKNWLLTVEIGEILESFQAYVTSVAISDSQLLKRIANTDAFKLRAAVTTEQAVAEYNSNRTEQMPKVIAIYPSEGSVIMDYQLCIAEADWVTPAKTAAIEQFREFLGGKDPQNAIFARGYRPALVPLSERLPLTRANGVDLAGPRKISEGFSGEELQKIVEKFPVMRPPMTTVLIIDASGSMQGAPLEYAQKALKEHVSHALPGDRFALIRSASEVEVLSGITESTDEIIKKIGEVQALGGSALYDSLIQGMEMVSGADMIRARKNILLITDGGDRNSRNSFEQLLQASRNAGTRHDTNIFIIGIASASGDFSDFKLLARDSEANYIDSALSDPQRATNVLSRLLY